ncbi:CAP domain-containing protein [Nonomuraea ferruginea]
MGQRTPADVVKAWMNSSGHRANIMNCSYNLIGVGAVKNSSGQIYWTQNFAAR